MDRLDLAAIVVGSGTMVFRFQDDQPHRFVANPLFVQWVPLLNYPDSSVIIRRGEQPVLVLSRPEDFWHLPPALPEAQTAAQFEVRIISAPNDLTAHLPAEESRTALIGPMEQWDGILPSAQRNPEPLLNFLHFHRARKTAWEVACLRRAAAIAAPGHHAAETAFREGGSEYDILIAFLSGCRQTETELPYGAIVALNEHGATLHYQHREREVHRPRDIHSLLIDAGCQFNGYASDITRSYSYRQDEFAEMIADVDQLQQQLCDAIQPGVAFPDLHRRTHFAVGELLKRWDLVRMEP
jgi:Xaa-Pro dipeptidase